MKGRYSFPILRKIEKISGVIFTDIVETRSRMQAIADESGSALRMGAEEIFAVGVIHSVLRVLIEQGVMGEHNDSPLKGYVEECDVDVSGIAEMFAKEFAVQAEAGAENAPADPVEDLLRNAITLRMHNANPAFSPIEPWISDQELAKQNDYAECLQHIQSFLASQRGNKSLNLYDMLCEPARRYPDSLADQLEYMKNEWAHLLGDVFQDILRALDYLRERDRYFDRAHDSFSKAPEYSLETYIYSADSAGAGASADHAPQDLFSKDSAWMPEVVLLAKSTLVWLDQLSKKYAQSITRLDQIPEQELDTIASRGFNALWLIGLWERSPASKKIKNLCGNPDAASSAYSLYSNNIAGEVGGWEALTNLKEKCSGRGIRLAADMVPNHTGIDSEWIYEHPDWFLSIPYPPYPNYGFNSENLSSNPRFSIRIEDHYFDQSDASVVFKHEDTATGEVRYMYHGNDGTSTPWNDTAQLNYLNPAVRQAITESIINIAKVFPIIRFDAAMTLAKEHIQRLWFPDPGSGGAIASRSEHGMTKAEFNTIMPREFWRELVDRVQKDVPDTLLLAEAFWMMEGYFVRSLGMHRVYNSAFMNMLKNEENAQYREIIKSTVEFDPNILKRFVNFMNNPDEESAIAQFGDGDKYFGVCTLMITMPGLPMFGHGQVEGFSEKYGMEFKRSYFNETERSDLIARHEAEIFPLMKQRGIFADVENFRIYDFLSAGAIAGDGSAGAVNENIYAYSNASQGTRSLVVYNNAYEQAAGYISADSGAGGRSGEPHSLAEALGITSEGSCIKLYDCVHKLWYAYTSAEIRSAGLNLVLNGYETRVYTSIEEVWGEKYKQIAQEIREKNMRGENLGYANL